jgi:hypothetical protein
MNLEDIMEAIALGELFADVQTYPPHGTGVFNN